MFIYEDEKLLFKKKYFRTKAIQKILLEDDILIIEYRNKHGHNADVTITNPRSPDIADIENFLVNIISGYKNKKLDELFLNNFGKSIYNQLRNFIDPDYTGFGKMKSIRFGRYIIEKAFEGAAN